MRDPVERIWSHIRMQAQRFPTMFDQPLREVLKQRHADANYAMRTRYDRTISALDEAIEPDELYFGFYEDLFTEDRVREICSFVGIDYVTPDFDRRRNASERRQMTSLQRRRVRSRATSVRCTTWWPRVSRRSTSWPSGRARGSCGEDVPARGGVPEGWHHVALPVPQGLAALRARVSQGVSRLRRDRHPRPGVSPGRGDRAGGGGVGPRSRGGPVNAQALHLASMHANPTYYYEYFAGLLMTRPRAG